MNTRIELVEQGLSSSSALSSLFRLPKRNIGCAILVAAIEDYLGLDEQAHASAAQFLFATTREYQEHYDWVVAMAGEVNRTWLREALNHAKPRWDQERSDRKLRARLAAELRNRLPA